VLVPKGISELVMRSRSFPAEIIELHLWAMLETTDA
jgi:hypothetical protein